MNIGLLARQDNTGLGTQTFEFYRHMKPAKTWVIDISRLNGFKQYPERYPDAWNTTQGFPGWPAIDDFLKGLDAVFIVETPYNYDLIKRANELGVKIVLQYNWEFLDYLSDPNLPKPDLFAPGTKWHFDELPFENKKILPVPIARDVLPFVRKTKFKRFLHIAGRPAVHDRNGTNTVIEAASLVKSDAEIVIRVQQDLESYGKLPDNIKVVQQDIVNYHEAYDGGDVLLMPRRYGGLCLPVQEALSCGMPVIMGDNTPYDFSPSEELWKLPAEKIGELMTRTMIDIYQVGAQALADKIDEFASFDSSRAQFESILADQMAQRQSWKALKPVYDKTFEDLCNNRL